METLVKVMIAVVAVVVLAIGGFQVFEHFEQADKARDAGKPCASLDKVTGAPRLPAGFRLPAGQRLLKVEQQGKTSIVYASTAGNRQNLVAVRDRVVTALAASGYRVTHRDQEPTFEADAGLRRGKVDDSINVRPLCSGRAVVRYTLHK